MGQIKHHKEYNVLAIVYFLRDRVALREGAGQGGGHRLFECTHFYLFFLFSPKQYFQDKSCSSKNAGLDTAKVHRDSIYLYIVVIIIIIIIDIVYK